MPHMPSHPKCSRGFWQEQAPRPKSKNEMRKAKNEMRNSKIETGKWKLENGNRKIEKRESEKSVILSPSPVILSPSPVILSEAKNLCSCKVEKQLPRFFAEFTLSELPGFFASLRMTGEGLRMTDWKSSPSAER